FSADVAQAVRRRVRFNERERSAFFHHDQEAGMAMFRPIEADGTGDLVARDAQCNATGSESNGRCFHRVLGCGRDVVADPLRRIAGKIDNLDVLGDTFDLPFGSARFGDIFSAEGRTNVAVFPFLDAAMRNAFHAKAFESLRAARIEKWDGRVHAASFTIWA